MLVVYSPNNSIISSLIPMGGASGLIAAIVNDAREEDRWIRYGSTRAGLVTEAGVAYCL